MNDAIGHTDVRRARVRLPHRLRRLSAPITVAQFCVFCLSAAYFSAAAESPNASSGGAGAKKGTAKSGTSALAEQEIPLSVFVMPSGPKEGRDPFFPNSSRPYASAKPPQTKGPVPEFTLILNGITPGKLVMINGHSFSEGEEGEVNTSAGKKRLRCIKIKEDSAIMELVPEGERRELRLRPGL